MSFNERLNLLPNNLRAIVLKHQEDVALADKMLLDGEITDVQLAAFFECLYLVRATDENRWEDARQYLVDDE